MSWVRMWEARVAPGRLDEAVAWVRTGGVPKALTAGASEAEGFRAEGADERIVLITRWVDRTSAGAFVEGPPAAVLAFGSAWVFEAISAAG